MAEEKRIKEPTPAAPPTPVAPPPAPRPKKPFIPPPIIVEPDTAVKVLWNPPLPTREEEVS